jgi:hypothetical protein
MKVYIVTKCDLLDYWWDIHSVHSTRELADDAIEASVAAEGSSYDDFNIEVKQVDVEE